MRCRGGWSSAAPEKGTATASWQKRSDTSCRAPSREVTAGADMGFDGAFVTNGRLNIVEVKYLRGPSGNVSRLRPSIERLANSITSYGWRNAQIILAVVFENAEEVPRATELLKKFTSEMPIPMVIRCFSLAELQARFGVGGGEG